MSITSGGMGRSVGQAFADAGFGGSFAPDYRFGGHHRKFDSPVTKDYTRPRQGTGVFTRPGEQYLSRPDPRYNQGMSRPAPGRGMKDRGFERKPGDDSPKPGLGFSPAGARAFGVAPSRGGDGNRGATGQQAQGRQDERQHKLPTFRNAAGKKIPAGKVAVKAVSKLIHGGKLTKNQNLVVGKAIRNMNPDQRRTFVNEVALRRGAGKNVNVVKKNLVKPIGKAIKVAKAHRQANRAKKR